MSDRLRVVFMGTPEFAVSSLDACHSNFDVVAVYSQPDRAVGRGLQMTPPPVKRRALELGITAIEQPEKLSVPGEFEKLQAYRPDIIVVVAYGQILRKNVLELPRLGCVNVHSSLLPRWRGAAPIHWAVLSGDQESGVTTMHLVEKLDAGDILLQEKTALSPLETTQSLHDRLAAIGARLIVPTLNGLASGELKGIRQDEAQVTYASKLTKEMEQLDLQQPALALERKVRALSSWPGCSVQVRIGTAQERLKIKRVELRPEIRHAAGQLIDYAGMALLTTTDGALALVETQWDGKKPVDMQSLLNGLKGRGVSLPLSIQGGSLENL